MSRDEVLAVSSIIHLLSVFSVCPMFGMKDNLGKTLVVSNHDIAELLTDGPTLERRAMLAAASKAKAFVR